MRAGLVVLGIVLMIMAIVFFLISPFILVAIVGTPSPSYTLGMGMWYQYNLGFIPPGAFGPDSELVALGLLIIVSTMGIIGLVILIIGAVLEES
ncbi:MAG: hypothetical protein ACETWM_14765 [Candidatus Lokiarchaeia archaeon]